MATTTTKSHIYARPAHNEREAWRFGFGPESEGYGRVQVMRRTTTQRRADGAIDRLLDEQHEDEVLFEVNAADAERLVKSLTSALIASVKPVQPEAM